MPKRRSAVSSSASSAPKKAKNSAEKPSTASSSANSRSGLFALTQRNRKEYYSSSASSGPSPAQQNIKKLFDQQRTQQDDPDSMGPDSTMAYLQSLNIHFDGPDSVAIHELLEAPETANLTRSGFENGWSSVSTPATPCDTIPSQLAYVQLMQQRLRTDSSYLKDTYKAAFKYAKNNPNARIVPPEIAIDFWQMFFRSSSGGIEWNTSSTKWLDLWVSFFSTKVNKPVNKDLWAQFAVLVDKTREADGETLNWWTEDGAWPTAIDDFVEYVKQNRDGNVDMT